MKPEIVIYQIIKGVFFAIQVLALFAGGNRVVEWVFGFERELMRVATVVFVACVIGLSFMIQIGIFYGDKHEETK